MEIKDRIRRNTKNSGDWYIDITDLTLQLFDNDLLTNIIEKVEVEAPYHCTDEDKVFNLTREYIKDIKDTMSEFSSIDFDAISMFITFKNGKEIEINNSEFGFIRAN